MYAASATSTALASAAHAASAAGDWSGTVAEGADVVMSMAVVAVDDAGGDDELQAGTTAQATSAHPPTKSGRLSRDFRVPRLIGVVVVVKAVRPAPIRSPQGPAIDPGRCSTAYGCQQTPGATMITCHSQTARWGLSTGIGGHKEEIDECESDPRQQGPPVHVAPKLEEDGGEGGPPITKGITWFCKAVPSPLHRRPVRSHGRRGASVPRARRPPNGG